MASADMTGRVCVVTGANRGIGRATAEGLAALGADLLLLCRRSEDGEAVAQAIERQGHPRPEVVEADLSSQAQIRTAAAEIQSCHPQLHVLINNAGIIPQGREVTVDGFEMQFAVNHLAYFLVTNLLLPQLRGGGEGRVGNGGAGGKSHTPTNFADPQS